MLLVDHRLIPFVSLAQTSARESRFRTWIEASGRVLSRWSTIFHSTTYGSRSLSRRGHRRSTPRPASRTAVQVPRPASVVEGHPVRDRDGLRPDLHRCPDPPSLGGPWGPTAIQVNALSLPCTSERVRRWARRAPATNGTPWLTPAPSGIVAIAVPQVPPSRRRLQARAGEPPMQTPAPPGVLLLGRRTDKPAPNQVPSGLVS